MATRQKPPAEARKKVMIVDDHPAIREALQIRISFQQDLEVCGEAADVVDALRVAAATNPDVAIIDIALESGSGIDLIKRLKARNSKVRMIVWSGYSEDLYAERALRAGAMGYLTKGEATGQILEAIRHVLNGKVFLSPAMTDKLLRRSVSRSGSSLGQSPVDALADRELEVFRLIGSGVKTQGIADRLHLSVKTVETYRARIREKLSLSNGTELVHHATQWVLENS